MNTPQENLIEPKNRLGRHRKDRKNPNPEVTKYQFSYDRHTKLTEECVKKLEEAFSIGSDVSMACYYANISRQTYYTWVKDNPALLDRFDDLRQKVPLKALTNIARGVEAGDIPLSERVLARRYPDEHADPIRLRHSGEIKDGDDTEIVLQFREALKKRLAERRKKKAKQDGEI